MYDIAKKYKVEMPTLRPTNLSQDNSSTIDVIDHALEVFNISAGHIILLQVTTPLRSKNDYSEICYQYESLYTDCTSMISVNKYMGQHPDKIQKIQDGYLESYLGKESMVPRQSLPEVYELNGAFYITSFNEFKKNNSFYSNKIKPRGLILL